MSHKKVANTEDRVESYEPVCGYRQCQARLRPSVVADGWNFCDEDCWRASMMEQSPEPDPEEDE